MPHALKRRVDLATHTASLVDHYSSVAEPQHPKGRLLMDYWRDVVARHGNFVIGRDIPARPIAGLLANINITEPLPGGADMRVRLSGTAVRRRFGSDIAGARLSEMFPPADFRHHLAANFEVLASGMPRISHSSLKRGSVEELHIEVVVLPILDRDLRTPILMVGVFYFD